MQREKKKITFIKVPIFNQRIYFTDWKHAKENNGLDVNLYEAICYLDKEDRICFCCDKPRDDLLVHESIHLANFIIDRCLLFVTPQHDELTAYLTTYIYKKVKEHFKDGANV